MPSGSNACFNFLMASTVSSPSSSLRLSLFFNPTHHLTSCFFLGIVVQQNSVEVAVAHVSHNSTDQSALLDIVTRLLDDVCQLADRHRNIRCPDMVAAIPSQSHDRPQCLLASGPQLRRLIVVLGK